MSQAPDIYALIDKISKQPFLASPQDLIALQKAMSKQVATLNKIQTANANSKPPAKPENLLEQVSSFITGAGEAVAGTIDTGLDGLSEFADDVIKALAKQAKIIGDGVGKAIGEIPKAVDSLLDDVATNLGSAITSTASWLNEGLSTVGARVESLPKFIAETATDLSSQVTSQLSSATKAIGDNLTSSLEHIGMVVAKAVDGAITAGNEILADVGTHMTQAVNQFKKSIETMIDGIADAFNDTMLAITKGFSAMTKVLEKAFTFNPEALIDQVKVLRAKSEELAREWNKPA